MKPKTSRSEKRFVEKSKAAEPGTARGTMKVANFSSASERLASEYDVLMGYQIFLGRNPENSFVIKDKKARPIKEMVRGFLASPEFQDLVGQPLVRGAKLIHSDLGMALGPEHITWIQDLVTLPEDRRAALERAVSWRELFGILSAIEFFQIKSPQVSAAPGQSPATRARGDVDFTELVDGMRRIEALLRAILNGQMLPMNADVPVPRVGNGKTTEGQSSTW
jgi:hypothetical protein